MASSEKSKSLEPRAPEWVAFGKRVTALREQRGLSRKELADELGTTRMSIYRVEKGVTPVAYHRIKEWARALKASPTPLARLVLR